MSYDAAWNLISSEIKKTSHNVIGKFSYDDLYQLKSEKGVASHEYTHDSLNNCVKKDGNLQETNSLNQLLKTYNQTFSYDKNGNRSSDETNSYKYDALDRLTTVFTKTEEIHYTYDSFNRRLAKTIKNLSGEILEFTNYLYFGQNEVGSYDKKGNLKEFRTLGTGKGAEIGATVAIEIENHIYFLNHDHNGNIVSLIDKDTLKIAESYRYTAFGEEIIYDANDRIGNPWRFSSKRVDEETGFINFGRRYYDCKNAKWISPDPIGFEGGPNLCAYVMNNPLTNSDLYGLECANCRRGVVGAVGDKVGRELNRAVTRSVERLADKIGSYIKNLFKSSDSDTQRIYYEEDDHEKGDKQSRNIDLTEYNRTVLPNTGMGFSNGIMNELKDAVKSTLMISDLAGGIHVDLSYKQTYGLRKDVFECYRNLYNRVPSKPEKVLREKLDKFFKNASKNAQWLEVAHSGGAIVLRNVLEKYPEEYRSRIHVIAIAPAAYIRKGLCASVRHYVSERDFVPLFDCEGAIACRDTTTTLKPHKDAHFHDHNFDSPTYTDVLKQNIRDFIINYGEVK